MRLLKAALFLPLLLLFLFAGSYCYGEGIGTTTGEFLVKALGARAAGMGNAFSAIEGDVNVLLWNPAGIATLNQSEVSFLYTDLSMIFGVEGAGGMYQSIFLYGTPWGKRGVIALGVQYEEQGKIAYTTDNPEVIATYNLGANYSVLLSYARRISPCLTIGITPKIIHTGLWKYGDTGWAADVGLLFQGDKLNLGFSINNIGKKLVMRDAYQADSLPQNFKLGLSYKLLRSNFHKFTMAIDLTRSLNSEIQVNCGMEYWYSGILALRLGYLNEGGGVTGFAQGIGVRYKGYEVDFASVPWGELGPVQKLSLTIYL